MDKIKVIHFFTRWYTFLSIITITFNILINFTEEIKEILNLNKEFNALEIIFIVTIFCILTSFIISLIAIGLIKIIFYFYLKYFFADQTSIIFNNYCKAHIKCIDSNFRKQEYIILKEIINSEELSSYPKIFSKIFLNSLIENCLIKDLSEED